jgi:hypothetical protein
MGVRVLLAPAGGRGAEGLMDDNRIALAPDATLPDLVRYAIASDKIADIEKLLEIQTAWELKKAEEEFIAARARLEFPPIPRSKRALNSYYAPLETIQEIVTPILKSEGFTLSFTSSEPDERGMVAIIGKLSRGKHSETGTIFQPIGTVSRGMNANQALASAVSYGERYVTQMLLNLRFVGMDDDAQSLSYITEEQVRQLEDQIQAIGGLNAQETERFLRYHDVKSITDIKASVFNLARKWIIGWGEKRKKEAVNK